MEPNDDNESILYEVNLDADASIAGPFDTWLRDHIADMLQFGGFLSAEILDDPAALPGRIRRIVQYRLRNQAALDTYLRDHAPTMRAQGVAHFGDKFTTERRVLAHREEFIRGAVSTENCLNCGEVLTGQHCSHCGQRARVRVLSLTGLLRDLLGDLTEFDSRIWRTLRPLAFKPGILTVDFLRGRRTHYTPPFRMYLVLSVAFFLAASFNADPGGDLKFGFDGEGGASLQIDGEGAASLRVDGDAADAPAAGEATGSPSADDKAPATPPPATSAPAAPPVDRNATPADSTTPAGAMEAPPIDADVEKVINQVVKRLPRDEQENARKEMEAEFRQMSPAELAPVKRLIADPCGEDSLKMDIGPTGEKYEPRLREACRKIVADSKSFGRAVFDNIPKMMFIFLPLMAGLMFVLYLGSGRYYVEHLLFFVHYHAFFFLGGLAIIVLDRLAAAFGDLAAASWLRSAESVLTTVFAFYVPYYLYRAMRRVYGQRRVVTLIKFSLLGVGYLFFMTLTVVGLVFYTALTL